MQSVVLTSIPDSHIRASVVTGANMLGTSSSTDPQMRAEQVAVPMRAGGPATEGQSDLPPVMHGVLRAVASLIDAVHCSLAGESASAREHAAEALQSLHGCSGPNQALEADSSAGGNGRRGGLAPWQIRRVSTHIQQHLSDTIRCEHLANLVGLSLSHFMRAFRDSFGAPPHAYLMQRRIERAQGLILTTNMALGQIALECGLADQSHLSRLFQRFVGESPAAWRRARIHAEQAAVRARPDPVTPPRHVPNYRV